VKGPSSGGGFLSTRQTHFFFTCSFACSGIRQWGILVIRPFILDLLFNLISLDNELILSITSLVRSFFHFCRELGHHHPLDYRILYKPYFDPLKLNDLKWVSGVVFAFQIRGNRLTRYESVMEKITTAVTNITPLPPMEMMFEKKGD